MLVVTCCMQVVLCGAELAHTMRKAAALACACTIARELPAQLRVEDEGDVVDVVVLSPDGVHGATNSSQHGANMGSRR